MIYVDTDTMMAPLLKGLTVSTDPEQQVSVMLNTLLARPNLEQVVHLTNPKAASLSSAEMARQVESLQDNISIKPLSTKNLFQLSYTDRDPDKGLNVSQTLLSIFVDSNIGNKRHDLEGAQSFLDTKVNEYETLVRQAEQRRTAFRQANLECCPTPSRRTRPRSRWKLPGSSMTAPRRGFPACGPNSPAFPRSSTSMVPARWCSSTGNMASDRAAAACSSVWPKPSRTLIDLKSRFTDDHPDVKAVKRQIAQLQAELSAMPADGAQGTGNQSIPNPVYVQTQSKLSDAETDVALQSQTLHEAQGNMDRAHEDELQGHGNQRPVRQSGPRL